MAFPPPKQLRALSARLTVTPIESHEKRAISDYLFRFRELLYFCDTTRATRDTAMVAIYKNNKVHTPHTEIYNV